MISILSAAATRALADFAREEVLLAFDYDGTLAPIAASPSCARMRATTCSLLKRVAVRYPCVVISGRSYADISRCVRGVPVRAVFGNHGIEPFWTSRGRAATVRRWLSVLESRLTDVPGVIVEDKQYSIAIHYRRASNRARTRRAIADAVAELKGVHTIEGKAAVNLVPGRRGYKGLALRRACGITDCRTAVYIGDDSTDEDAFGAMESERLLAIRVGRADESAARFVLPRQRDIEALLRVLLRLRTSAPLRR